MLRTNVENFKLSSYKTYLGSISYYLGSNIIQYKNKANIQYIIELHLMS